MYTGKVCNENIGALIPPCCSTMVRIFKFRYEERRIVFKFIIVFLFMVALTVVCYKVCMILHTTFPGIKLKVSDNTLIAMINGQLSLASTLCNFNYYIVFGQFILIFKFLLKIKNCLKIYILHLIFIIGALYCIYLASNSIVYGLDYIDYISYMSLSDKPIPFDTMTKCKNIFISSFLKSIKFNIIHIVIFIGFIVCKQIYIDERNI